MFDRKRSAIALATAALAVGAAGCGGEEDVDPGAVGEEIEQAVPDNADEARDAAGEATQDAEGAAGEAAQDAEDAAGDAAQDAEGAAEDAQSELEQE